MLRKIKILIVVILTFLHGTSLVSQETTLILKNETLIVYKISSYTVDIDKLVQKEFLNDENIKIISTCIPAGILVFELKFPITSLQKETIQNRLKKANRTIQFFQLQGFTLYDSEEECSTFRSN